jgi:hypothetical protein
MVMIKFGMCESALQLDGPILFYVYPYYKMLEETRMESYTHRIERLTPDVKCEHIK